MLTGYLSTFVDLCENGDRRAGEHVLNSEKFNLVPLNLNWTLIKASLTVPADLHISSLWSRCLPIWNPYLAGADRPLQL